MSTLHHNDFTLSVERDPTTDALLLTASPDDITRLKEGGFLRPHTLSGEVLSCLGKYEANVVLHRWQVDAAGTSTASATSLTAKKLALVETARIFLRALIPLEKSLNQGKDAEAKALKTLQDALQLLPIASDALKQLSQTFERTLAPDLPLSDVLWRYACLGVLWLKYANRELVETSGSFRYGYLETVVNEAMNALRAYRPPLSVTPTFAHDLVFTPAPPTETTPDPTEPQLHLSVPSAEPTTQTLSLADYGHPTADETTLRSMQRYLAFKQSPSPTAPLPLKRWASAKFWVLDPWRRAMGPSAEWHPTLPLSFRLLHACLTPLAYLVDSVIGFWVGLLSAYRFQFCRERLNTARSQRLVQLSKLSAQQHQEDVFMTGVPSVSLANQLGMRLHQGVARLLKSLYTLGLLLQRVGADIAAECRGFQPPPLVNNDSSFDNALTRIQSTTPATHPTLPTTAWEKKPTPILHVTTPLDPYASGDVLSLATEGVDGALHTVSEHPYLAALAAVTVGTGGIPFLAPHLFGAAPAHTVMHGLGDSRQLDPHTWSALPSLSAPPLKTGFDLSVLSSGGLSTRPTALLTEGASTSPSSTASSDFELGAKLLPVFHRLPNISGRCRLRILNDVGTRYGFTSPLYRAVYDQCYALTDASALSRSLQHLLAYVSVLIRLPLALVASVIRLIALKNLTSAPAPLFRVCAELGRLLVDSYARITTALFHVSSTVGRLIVQALPERVLGWLSLLTRVATFVCVHAKKALGIRPQQNERNILNHTQRALAVERTMHHIGTSTAGVLGITAAQRFTHPCTSLPVYDRLLSAASATSITNPLQTIPQ